MSAKTDENITTTLWVMAIALLVWTVAGIYISSKAVKDTVDHNRTRNTITCVVRG